MNISIKYLIAIDSFKEALSSIAAGKAVKKGVISADREAEVHVLPVGDGGEGSLDAVFYSRKGIKRRLKVSDPFGEKVWAHYGIFEQGKVAVIESAAAVGLGLIKRENRDILNSSSAGVGDLIRDALEYGCGKIIVCCGGSATNDGGLGMAKALGAELYDIKGKKLKGTGSDLLELKKIDISGLHKNIQTTAFIIASDVTNPLTGKKGAARVYAPQKGASAKEVDILENGLKNYEKILKKDLGSSVGRVAGAGAAGGLGAGLIAFCNAELKSGSDIIFELTGFDRLASASDIIITGEGKTDMSTLSGKLVSTVTRRAKAFKKPVIALTGSKDLSVSLQKKLGIDALLPINPGLTSLQEALTNTDNNLTNAGFQIASLIKAVK